MLLQLTKEDALQLGKIDQRIEYALIFERAIEDPDGVLSRQHWPRAGKTWRFILECSDTIPAFPFSLEQLGLSRDYSGQSNPQYVEPADELIIQPYLKGYAQLEDVPRLVSVHGLLAGIRNYDSVVRLEPVRSTRVQRHQRRLHDPWLGEALKTLYDHRCQICVHDFKPRYGIPYADTRFLKELDQGGEPVSKNLIVLCPNHGAILGAAKPTFDLDSLAFTYKNGLTEKLMLRDHLVA